MSNPIFPLQLKQDSSYFSVEQVNVTIKGEMEGGYEVTRPRTTRAPRKIFSTGFTDISQSDLDTLLTFYDQVGQHSVFDWVNPTKGTTHVCRIEAWPEARYMGSGLYKRYNVGPIRIKEV